MKAGWQSLCMDGWVDDAWIGGSDAVVGEWVSDFDLLWVRVLIVLALREIETAEWSGWLGFVFLPFRSFSFVSFRFVLLLGCSWGWFSFFRVELALRVAGVGWSSVQHLALRRTRG